MISDAKPTFLDRSTPPQWRFLNLVWAMKFVFRLLCCFFSKIAKIHHHTIFVTGVYKLILSDMN